MPQLLSPLNTPLNSHVDTKQTDLEKNKAKNGLSTVCSVRIEGSSDTMEDRQSGSVKMEGSSVNMEGRQSGSDKMEGSIGNMKGRQSGSDKMEGSSGNMKGRQSGSIKMEGSSGNIEGRQSFSETRLVKNNLLVSAQDNNNSQSY